MLSKDEDFRQRALLYGPPPKVIWLTVGNAPTDIIATALRRHQQAIIAFAQEPETGLMVLRL